MFLTIFYEKRYKHTYRRAPILFAFDLFLLAVTLLLIGISYYWFSFEPEPSLISISATAPQERLISGQAFSFDVSIHNHTDIDQGNIDVSIDAPKTMILSTTSIYVSHLLPKEQKTLTIHGTLFSLPDQPVLISMRAKQDDSESMSHTRLKLVSRDTLFSSEIDVKNTAKTTDILPVKLSLKNDSEHIVMIRSLQKSLPSGTTLVLEQEKNIDLNPKEIFEINGTLTLTEVSPGDTTITITPVMDEGIPFPSARNTVHVQIPKLTVHTNAQYFTQDGDQIGRGPYPLTAGEETTIWSSISLQAGQEDIHDLSLIITLPENVRYTGKSASLKGASVKEMQKGRLHWSLDTLKAFGKTQVHIEFGITPTQNERISPYRVTKGIAVTGVYTPSGEQISLRLSNIYLD